LPTLIVVVTFAASMFEREGRPQAASVNDNRADAALHPGLAAIT